MELQKIIEEKTKEIIESGYIEELIKTNLEKTTGEIIEKALSSYSDFGKELKEKVSKSFKLDMDKLSIPEYHTMMMSYIKDEIDLYMKNDLRSKTQERIGGFFKPLERDEYKITEIVEAFKYAVKEDEYISSNEYYEEKEITCIIDDPKDGYIDIYLDPEEGTKKFNCEWQIRIKEDGIWHITSGRDGELHRARNIILTGFERLLFQMYSQKVKIINDSEDIDTYIS
jgi:hypothetical protein